MQERLKTKQETRNKGKFQSQDERQANDNCGTIHVTRENDNRKTKNTRNKNLKTNQSRKQQSWMIKGTRISNWTIKRVKVSINKGNENLENQNNCKDKHDVCVNIPNYKNYTVTKYSKTKALLRTNSDKKSTNGYGSTRARLNGRYISSRARP